MLRWSGRIEGAADADSLAAVVERRATFRGAFRPADGMARERLFKLAHATDDAVVLTDRTEIGGIASEYDALSLGLLRNLPYRAELVSWMRFSARHPQWPLDGLNAQAMSMSRAEAIGARCVLSNRVFAILDRFGLAGPLTAERGRILSATALVLFHRPETEDPVVTGRRFYRLWLTFTDAGFDFCPMSVLADDQDAARALCSRYVIARGRRLINVFRAGIRPPSAAIARARLPAESLVVPPGSVKEP